MDIRFFWSSFQKISPLGWRARLANRNGSTKGFGLNDLAVNKDSIQEVVVVEPNWKQRDIFRQKKDFVFRALDGGKRV